jgi:uncharacterized protein YndB with AHSA1/START domain
MPSSAGSSPARSAGLTLEIERVLDARRSVVFRAFSDPGELAKWWGPRGFTTPSLVLHARVGAGYRIEMQPPQGARFYLSGEFRVVDPPARLAYTFAWEEPDLDDLATLVDLSFRDLGESTEVALRQGPFKTQARRRLHHDGWADSFDKLEGLLRAAPTSRQGRAKAMEALQPDPPIDSVSKPAEGPDGTPS